MDSFYNWLKKDLYPFEYMITTDVERRYIFVRILCIFFGLILGVVISIYWISSWYIRLLCLLVCVISLGKFPNIFIKVQHIKRCGKIQDAVIIWVN